MNTSLFQGKLVHLGMDNPEELAKCFSGWRRDTEYYRLLDTDPVRMFSVKAFQKDFEANLEKKPFDDYLFTIYTLKDDRLIGFITAMAGWASDWANASTGVKATARMRCGWFWALLLQN